MKKLFFTLSIVLVIFIILNDRSFSQNVAIVDTINQYDSKGKKDGVWIEYLSKSFRVVRNDNKAKYYRYVRYQHGVLFHLYIINKLFIYKTRVVTRDTSDSLNKPILLYGIYDVYIDKKDKIIARCRFNDGWLIEDTTYSWTGQIEVTIDFLKKYNNIECSDLKKLYNESGIEYYEVYEILEDSKWRTVRIK